MLYFIITSVAILFIFTLKITAFFTWVIAKRQGVEVSLGRLFMMRMMGVPPDTIVDAMIDAHRAELKNITMDQLAAHYLAGGDINNVIHALEYATKSNLNLTFLMATAIDLAGYNVLEAVELSTRSRIIEIPSFIDKSKDGIQFAVQVYVKVHPRIDACFYEDGEETIIERTKQEMSIYIRLNKGQTVLKDYTKMPNLLIEKMLDRITSLKILSIEVSITKC